jgi:hypothetical protein
MALNVGGDENVVLVGGMQGAAVDEWQGKQHDQYQSHELAGHAILLGSQGSARTFPENGRDCRPEAARKQREVA